MTMRPIPWQNRRLRPGFTLVELLVVILIISILAALTAGAIFRFVPAQQVSNTRTILSKLAPILKVQWNALTEQANREPIPTAFVSDLVTIAGADTRRQRAVWVKIRQTQAFPMNFTEALQPGGTTYPQLKNLPPLQKYKTTLTNLGISATSNASYESAACLMMALQQGFSGGGFHAEDLGVAATSNFSAGTTGGTIPALVDSWGTPLAFVRWPKGSLDLNPSGATAGFHDPSDPEGTFAVASWISTNSTAFQNQFGFTPPSAGTSYTLVPLIVSAGPDQTLGFSDNFATPDATGAANDNISSAAQ
jgi:prepilin-type N-terminal cleavage/methylation domain-containing protein